MNWVSRMYISLIALVMIGEFDKAVSSPEIQEVIFEAPWYVNGGFGVLLFEGDEELKDGPLLVGRLGFDYSQWLSIEGGIMLAPSLDGNDVGTTFIDEHGNIVRERRRLGPDNTWAMGLTFDGLFHFTRWERIDPYVTLGGGITWYEDRINGKDIDPSIRAGGGVMYHFNDEWSIRADGRTFIVGNDTEANAVFDGGVMWNLGAGISPEFVAVGGSMDSDGDGLVDDEVPNWNTDPFDPDTDDDGLSDGEEVYEYKTIPTNPDTDFDNLKDGYDEIQKYGTNPLSRDTDKGGVADGHEVIEDSTNPLDSQDDLMLIELYIKFEYDKAEINPKYYEHIDVVGKVLKRNPKTLVRIEGHADQTKKSKKLYNKLLSKRRAEAVLVYLAEKRKIDRSRMTAHGYGFDRPKGPVDLENGNPEHRRVEVYISGIEGNYNYSESSLPPVEE